MPIGQTNRRALIAALGGAAAWPLVARGQQQAMPVIGFLHNGSLSQRREQVAFFHRGLAQLGYVEGRNIAIEYRWADGHNDQLPALAEDLVRHQVAVIATPGSTPSALAARAATQSIPIVFWVATDPVEAGLVASLNRPGANLTGITILGIELVSKRFEILRELVPTATSIGLLVNLTNKAATQASIREGESIARVLGVRLLTQPARDKREIEAAFATVAQQKVDALVSMTDPVFFSQIDQLVALEAHYNIPMISPFREWSRYWFQMETFLYGCPNTGLNVQAGWPRKYEKVRGTRMKL
jgi:putative ABC transport system substrate-binding protein